MKHVKNKSTTDLGVQDTNADVRPALANSVSSSAMWSTPALFMSCLPQGYIVPCGTRAAFVALPSRSKEERRLLRARLRLLPGLYRPAAGCCSTLPLFPQPHELPSKQFTCAQLLLQQAAKLRSTERHARQCAARGRRKRARMWHAAPQRNPNPHPQSALTAEKML